MLHRDAARHMLHASPFRLNGLKMSKTAKNADENLIQCSEDELRIWFDLLLELRSRGFTPEQVRSALSSQSPGLKKLRPTLENQSWCW